MFNYIFKGQNHTNTDSEFMRGLGMSREQIESVHQQRDFEAVEGFRRSREAAMACAVVTTSNGNTFDADETSINRMTMAVLAASGEDDSYGVQWALANNGAGIMSAITLGELKEAQQLAVLNMATLWERPESA